MACYAATSYDDMGMSNSDRFGTRVRMFRGDEAYAVFFGVQFFYTSTMNRLRRRMVNRTDASVAIRADGQ